ncbi:MAG: gluconate 2-dehydrogenase subunit 3 family protein [Gemmatimonadetes bacterium]|nr:gluconate 2-dehydrogenase subunit 3 family protein [Gemmatimonadota bacterium]
MSGREATRRDFVIESAGALGGAWLWLSLPSLGGLAACAREAAQNGDAFRMLTAEEGSALRAFAARIVPSDADVPGADEAGAAWFVDGALADHFFPAFADPVKGLLADLDRRANDAHGTGFASLDASQQDAIIHAVEQEPAFSTARLLVVTGVFADASYGGNRGDAGWQILGYRPQSAYQPPFGYYDAEAAASGGAS